MSQSDLFAVYCLTILLVVWASLGLCAWVFKQVASALKEVRLESKATRDTIDELYRRAHDASMSIVEEYREAKNDERRAEHPPEPIRRVIHPNAEAEAPEINWDVSATGTPNGSM